MLLPPFRPKIAIVELIHLVRNPRAKVDAVGHVPDRNLILRHAGPDGFPHAAADRAVKFANAVAGRRRAQGQHGHAEVLILTLRVLSPQPVEIRGRQSQAANVVAEVAIQQSYREIVMACGHRSVSCKNEARRGHIARFGEGEIVLFREPANPFHREERGVALVHVIDRRLQAQRLQRAMPADAEQDFLLQAHLQIAAVKLIGDIAIVLAIGGHIRIEKVEIDAADANLPDSGRYGTSVVVNFDGERTPVRPKFEAQREIAEVVIFVGFLLPARWIQVLLEVSLLVEQAHTHQRHTQIAGRFQMIAGEHTQASGKNRQALGQAELRREIGHQHGSGIAIGPAEPRGWASQIGIEFLELAV